MHTLLIPAYLNSENTKMLSEIIRVMIRYKIGTIIYRG